MRKPVMIWRVAWHLIMFTIYSHVTYRFMRSLNSVLVISKLLIHIPSIKKSSHWLQCRELKMKSTSTRWKCFRVARLHEGLFTQSYVTWAYPAAWWDSLVPFAYPPILAWPLWKESVILSYWSYVLVRGVRSFPGSGASAEPSKKHTCYNNKSNLI